MVLITVEVVPVEISLLHLLSTFIDSTLLDATHQEVLEYRVKQWWEETVGAIEEEEIASYLLRILLHDSFNYPQPFKHSLQHLCVQLEQCIRVVVVSVDDFRWVNLTMGLLYLLEDLLVFVELRRWKDRLQYSNQCSFTSTSLSSYSKRIRPQLE